MQNEKFKDLDAKIEKDICSGKLHGRLPGVLCRASELGVHHVTLTRDLRLPVQKKLLEIVPGQGTFVCSGHTVRQKYHTTGIAGTVESREETTLSDRMNSLAGRRGYHPVFQHYAEAGAPYAKYLQPITIPKHSFRLSGIGQNIRSNAAHNA